MRLDQWLVKHRLTTSRNLAQKLIAGGAIEVQSVRAGPWKLIKKASFDVSEGCEVCLKDGFEPKYASRAGDKLAGDLSKTGIEISGKTCLDMGQSTGGFTDCLLQQGAEKVVGVDVGRDQLAAKFKSHPLVTCLEGVNGRAIPDALFQPYAPDGFDVAVMDVSFISQTLILPEIKRFLKPNGVIISLVKPQFEVGKEGLGKGGIVKDPSLFDEVKRKIANFAESIELQMESYFTSPILGGDGNREYFAILRLSD